MFRFVLSREEGVTLELHRKIVETRVTGGSLHAMQRELYSNRWTRMLETIAAYHQHCEEHTTDNGLLRRAKTIPQHFGGQGQQLTYDAMPPILHNPDGYFDHEPQSTQSMSHHYVQHCSRFGLVMRSSSRLSGIRRLSRWTSVCTALPLACCGQ